MLNSSELRKGTSIILSDKIYQVIDYKYVKMKRTALAHIKLRDIIGGHTIEQSFQTDDKIVQANMDTHCRQYLYNSSRLYYFMEAGNFEQLAVDKSQVEDSTGCLKEGMAVEASSCKGRVLGIEIPVAVELKVIDT
jgi:elongation factor P